MLNRLTSFSVALVLTVLLFSSATNAQYRIDLSVGDAVGVPNETNVRLPVYLSNPFDTVKVFQFWLQLDRPDIALFNMNFDLTGTLLEDLGASVNSISGLNIDALVTGGNITPGEYILPQAGPTPLIYLLMDIENVPDTSTERLANILVQTDFIDHFTFADQWGQSIGILTDTATVTECYRCLTWIDDVCLNWQRVSVPSCDSTYIYLDTFAYIDTTQIHASNGTVTAIPPFICGDNNNDGVVNISDLTFIVDYMFRGGPPPVYLMALDCDGNGAFDISDLTCFVCFLFQGCDPPVCLGL